MIQWIVFRGASIDWVVLVYFNLLGGLGCFNILVGVRCFCGRNSLGYLNGLEGLVCFIGMECFGWFI